MALGLRLGADVPFFLGGHNAWVEGIGEQLTPIDLPRQWLAVVKPPASIETHAIFASPLLARNTKVVILEGFLAGAGIAELSVGFGCNDLQPAAEQQCPEVAQAAQVLEAWFGNSRMTGSGSAVFARAGTGDQPTTAMPADLAPGWVGRMCRSLDAHPLLGWCQG
jgi:4-diphosphocytidyl-2-C-methyl-D-erythritol kinase